MTLAVPISRETEASLAAKARIAGVDLPTYVARCLDAIAKPMRSLEEISGPVAEAFKKSGMTEDELADLLETEKHAMRAERHARK